MCWYQYTWMCMWTGRFGSCTVVILGWYVPCAFINNKRRRRQSFSKISASFICTFWIFVIAYNHIALYTPKDFILYNQVKTVKRKIIAQKLSVKYQFNVKYSTQIVLKPTGSVGGVIHIERSESVCLCGRPSVRLAVRVYVPLFVDTTTTKL